MAKPGSGRAVLGRALESWVASLRVHELEVRRGEPESVHDARVTLRRLRSALTTFRPLLDADVAGPLRVELVWLAQELGGARDLEVLRARLDASLDREPDDLAVAAARTRIDTSLRHDEEAARAELEAVMRSARYRQLFEDLDRLSTAVWAEGADRASTDDLVSCVRREWKRLLGRVESSEHAPLETVDVSLHDVRKAAKRVRYAAEVMQPKYGDRSQRTVTATEQIQTALGDHHDSVVAREALMALAAEARRDGDDTFVYGRLHAFEEADAARSLKAFRKAWKRAGKKKVTAWLR